MQQITLRSG